MLRLAPGRDYACVTSTLTAMRPLLLLAFVVPAVAAQPGPGNWFSRSGDADSLSPEDAAEAAREWESVRAEIEALAGAGCVDANTANVSACYDILAERDEREISALLDTLYADAVPAMGAQQADLTHEMVIAGQRAWLDYMDVVCHPEVSETGTGTLGSGFRWRLGHCIVRETRHRLATLRDQAGVIRGAE